MDCLKYSGLILIFCVGVLALVHTPDACADANANANAYKSAGEHGEISFSDLESETATPIALTTHNTPAMSSAEQVESMLRVADELNRARLEREAARAAKRPKPQPTIAVQPVAVNRYPIYGYPYRKPHHKPHRRPGHPHDQGAPENHLPPGEQLPGQRPSHNIHFKLKR